MTDATFYMDFVRSRITELRIIKGVSEHKMSLDLGKSGSYIRSISSGASMPSVRELFNIMDYLSISPMDFFAPSTQHESSYTMLCERLRDLDESSLQKVITFLSWIAK